MSATLARRSTQTLMLALALAWASAATDVLAAERAIEKEVVVPATLDQAWAAWTTREGITSFFAPDATIEPRAGGAFHIYIDPGAPAGSKGADDMRFLALQPKKMISFDWNAPPSLPEVRAQRTVVAARAGVVSVFRPRIASNQAWGARAVTACVSEAMTTRIDTARAASTPGRRRFWNWSRFNMAGSSVGFVRAQP